MSEDTLCQLIAALRAIPPNAFLRVNSERAFFSAEVPVGELCHEAANALAQQHKQAGENEKSKELLNAMCECFRNGNSISSTPAPVAPEQQDEAILFVAMLWKEYALCDDNRLTEGALKLKQKLLKAFGLQAPVAKGDEYLIRDSIMMALIDCENKVPEERVLDDDTVWDWVDEIMKAIRPYLSTQGDEK